MFGAIKYKIRKPALWIGFGMSFIIIISAIILDRGLGKNVILITPHDSSIVELNRVLYSRGDPIAEIYGNTLSREPIRVVHFSKASLIHPVEDPSLKLLPVNKQKGENPLQVKTIWFFTKFSLPPFAFLGIVGFFLPRKPRKEKVSD
jgi:hypothetical protein